MTTICVPEDYTVASSIENTLKKFGLKCTCSDSYSIKKDLSEEEKSEILKAIADDYIKLFVFIEDEKEE